MKTETKAINLSHVKVNGRPVTYFDVYNLVEKTWIFQYRDSVDGHLKTGAGCLRKAAKAAY